MGCLGGVLWVFSGVVYVGGVFFVVLVWLGLFVYLFNNILLRADPLHREFRIHVN